MSSDTQDQLSNLDELLEELLPAYERGTYNGDAASRQRSLIQAHIDRARLDELDRLIDIESKQFKRWTQMDVAHFFDVVGKRYRALEARLRALGPEEGDDRTLP